MRFTPVWNLRIVARPQTPQTPQTSRPVTLVLAARVHAMLGGAHSMLAGEDGALGGLVAEIVSSVPAQSIAGGTDEIQHTILGERALGLPREPSFDRDLPFRDVPRNA